MSGTRGTDLTIAIPHQEKMEMIRKSEFRVIHIWQSQICNQIPHIDNIFFVICCEVFTYLINRLAPHGITKIQKIPPKLGLTYQTYYFQQ